MSDSGRSDVTLNNLETAIPEPQEPRFRVNDFAVLLKPKIMSLVVFTALVGILMAPGGADAQTGLIAVLCIAIGAGASGAINMWYDRDIDRIMRRTMDRPIPAGRMDPKLALVYGTVLAIGSIVMMTVHVGTVAGGLLALTIFYYVFIYTAWLKRRTPQNIVIGGAAGAFPPLVGWAAVTGSVDPGAIALFMIIFLWTPPHSWALALFRRGDYAAAGVPMMPVVAGERETKRQMLIYTVLMIAATLAPSFLGVSGLLYLASAVVLGGIFWVRCWRLWKHEGTEPAKPLFLFSILYLFLIFLAMIADRLLFIPVL
ncbi:MAG: protoheme IX farnesyltransferase [Rhodospirillales bacterium]|nr:protoheme IX farnesyltransferase [Rhodospirillales bacterium]MBO6785663.1 protoheme IX farnesyltransferase [Rhodospirillales bacterium]